jgi:putative transposase
LDFRNIGLQDCCCDSLPLCELVCASGQRRLLDMRLPPASGAGGYGYRRITALLQSAGWQVGKDRVQRIWRREGLKVPQKQRPRRRLWLNDGSCVRLRPARANLVWSYDFVSAMTHDGTMLWMLTPIDEYTRECLAIRVARRLGRHEVIEALADVMLFRGIPENIRSDNGAEFVARELRE